MLQKVRTRLAARRERRDAEQGTRRMDSVLARLGINDADILVDSISRKEAVVHHCHVGWRLNWYASDPKVLWWGAIPLDREGVAALERRCTALRSLVIREDGWHLRMEWDRAALITELGGWEVSLEFSDPNSDLVAIGVRDPMGNEYSGRVTVAVAHEDEIPTEERQANVQAPEDRCSEVSEVLAKLLVVPVQVAPGRI